MTKTAAFRSGGPPPRLSRRLLPLLVCAALPFLGGSSAWAGEGLAVVLDPKIDGPLGKEEQARLELAVTGALRAAELQVVPAPDRQAIEEGEAELKGCRTDECQDRIGRLLSAQSVITQQWRIERAGAAPTAAAAPAAPAARAASVVLPLGRHKGKKKVAPPAPAAPIRPAVVIDPGQKGRFAFAVSVFNVTIGAVGAKEEATCPSCTTDEAAEALADLVKKTVLLEAARPRGKIEISSTPSADVLINGRKLGFTPYKREAYAGKQDITIARTGYRTHHVSVNVEEGKKAPLQVTLQQGADKSFREERGPRPRWRLVAGGAALGVGAIFMGFGISALSVNGRCAQDPVAPAMICDEVYRTSGVGAGLLVAGLALGAGGAVLLALPGDKRMVEVTAAPAPGGFGLRLAGNF